MSDGTDDVVDVLTEQIERRFDMSMDELRAAVAAAPEAHGEATELVRWHALLTEAQTAVDTAENDLLRAMETQTDTIDDPTMEIAQRANNAVFARDGRAMVVRWLLDPDAPGKRGPTAEQRPRPGLDRRRGPTPTTPAPPGPTTATTPTPGVRR
ncbi:hypothetical protein [Streptomyces sp. ST2-7A]|uniref:hypothetical protein n=1 Tax=Streptomyces sp. ST2-7A TaxID=2907214 RepID=UPI001F30CA37|nr:hypothetical protein [Streptomyces sp. ST2-7A]MCE7081706.1 hypothetical protein [Streptomyces sp. ST2-7A]